MKAAGVIVDDTAVTPRYVQGFRPERELPMIKRIAIGSLRNKILLILPVALVLSEVLPWLLTPVLMIGAAYLCFEGAEKLWELFSRHAPVRESPAAAQGPEHEDALVASAIRTDFILSAEIMVISLNEVADEPLLSRADPRLCRTGACGKQQAGAQGRRSTGVRVPDRRELPRPLLVVTAFKAMVRIDRDGGLPGESVSGRRRAGSRPSDPPCRADETT